MAAATGSSIVLSFLAKGVEIHTFLDRQVQHIQIRVLD